MDYRLRRVFKFSRDYERAATFLFEICDSDNNTREVAISENTFSLGFLCELIQQFLGVGQQHLPLMRPVVDSMPVPALLVSQKLLHGVIIDLNYHTNQLLEDVKFFLGVNTTADENNTRNEYFPPSKRSRRNIYPLPPPEEQPPPLEEAVAVSYQEAVEQSVHEISMQNTLTTETSEIRILPKVWKISGNINGQLSLSMLTSTPDDTATEDEFKSFLSSLVAISVDHTMLFSLVMAGEYTGLNTRLSFAPITRGGSSVPSVVHPSFEHMEVDQTTVATSDLKEALMRQKVAQFFEQEYAGQRPKVPVIEEMSIELPPPPPPADQQVLPVEPPQEAPQPARRPRRRVQRDINYADMAPPAQRRRRNRPRVARVPQIMEEGQILDQAEPPQELTPPVEEPMPAVDVLERRGMNKANKRRT